MFFDDTCGKATPGYVRTQISVAQAAHPGGPGPMMALKI
jgi:hypothetical protein